MVGTVSELHGRKFIASRLGSGGPSPATDAWDGAIASVHFSAYPQKRASVSYGTVLNN